jgi:Zn-finger nucleic acid-binding protein
MTYRKYMEKNWSIRYINDKVIERIKTRAKEYGLSIPKLLALDYDVDVQPKNNKAWTIHYLDKGTIDNIMKHARKENVSVADYLAKIDRFYNKKKDERNKLKGKVKQAKKELLKEFKVSLENLDSLL